MNLPLFTLELLHSYYSNGIFNTCRLNADAKTAKIMQRFQLLQYQKSGVFSLYSQDNSAQNLLQYISSQYPDQPLRFTLLSDSGLFNRVSELPLNWVGQVAFKTQVSNNSEDLINLSPTLSDRSVYQDNAIGFIELYPKDLLTWGTRTPAYQIAFSARAIQWRYQVFNRGQTNLQNPLISDETGLQFEAPLAFTSDTGEQGLLFSSGDRTFPLAQIPSQKFNLLDRLTTTLAADGRMIEKLLIKGLPTPGNNPLKHQTQTDKKITYTEINIYI